MKKVGIPPLIDFMGGTASGPVVAAKDFNPKFLLPSIRQTLRDYWSRYDHERPLPSEEKLVDFIYEAAISFLVIDGIYDATNLIVEFTREKILQAVDNLREGSTFG